MTPATDSENTAFQSLLPGIEGRLRTRFRRENPESKEEKIAVAVGHAFLLFLSATRRNKRVTAGTVAFYSARMTISGRQVGSAMRKYDAFSETNGEIQHPLSLSENDLDDLLEDRKNAWPTVLDRVGFELDWTDFMSDRSSRDRDIVGLLAKGYLRSEAAEAVGLSRPAVTQRMGRLKKGWEDLQEEGVH